MVTWWLVAICKHSHTILSWFWMVFKFLKAIYFIFLSNVPNVFPNNSTRHEAPARCARKPCWTWWGRRLVLCKSCGNFKRLVLLGCRSWYLISESLIFLFELKGLWYDFWTSNLNVLAGWVVDPEVQRPPVFLYVCWSTVKSANSPARRQPTLLLPWRPMQRTGVRRWLSDSVTEQINLWLFDGPGPNGPRMSQGFSMILIPEHGLGRPLASSM